MEKAIQKKRSGPSAGPVLALLFVLYGLALALSVVLAYNGSKELGAAGVLLVLTMAPVAFVVTLSLNGRFIRTMSERVDTVARVVQNMADHNALSDDARRVLNREHERELLRQAIEEDIATRNYDAALVLVRELADRFGFRADAEEFRQRITQVRAETLEREVSDAIAYLDGLIIQRRWEQAFADAQRIQRLYPESGRVEGLRDRVQQAKGSYKSDLERRFLLAAQEGRHEEALTLLKELDFYLTPVEAEPLREMARGVIGKARENLGVSFRLAVQDRRWREAARIGERIIAEFPNTRMAAEVRNIIDGLRTRAANGQEAAAT